MTSVRLFLGLCWIQAVQDQPTVDVTVLYDQLLGWLDKGLA